MRSALTSLASILLISVGTCITGCNSAEWLTGRIEPVTRIAFNPVWKSVEFYDTKNNDISIVGLEFNRETGSFSVESVTVANRSSEVIAADSERMQHIVEAQRVNVELHRAIGQNIAMALAAGGDAAATLISRLPDLSGTIDTPWGTGNLTTTSHPIAEPAGPPALPPQPEP